MAVRRYLWTWWDFVGGMPRAFCERRSLNPALYSRPVNFLFGNLALAGVFTAAIVRPRDFSSPAQLAVAAATGPLINVACVLFGMVAAWLLLQEANLRGMFAAFCYASAWLPLYVPVTFKALDFIESNAEGRWVVFGAAVAAQAFYLGYLIGGMARFTHLGGALMRSYILITGVLLLASVTGFVIWISKIASEAEAWNQPFAWNDRPFDWDTLRVANASRDSSECSKCWTSAADAVPGDVVAFAIYYHHHESERTVKGLRVRLSLPSVIQETGVVGATVWSNDNSPKSRKADGSAVLRIKSAEPVALRFVSGEWYSGRGSQTTALPKGVLVSDVLDDEGLSIGEIAPGPYDWGEVIVRFGVVSISGKAPLANPAHLAARAVCAGGIPRVVLSWEEIPSTTRTMIFKDGALVRSVKTNVWSDVDVHPGARHSYVAKACDDVRCMDGTSAPVSVQIPSCEQREVGSQDHSP